MNRNKYDALRLSSQLCFPLYAASREVVKKYRPFLDKLGITYTQYVTMMVLWEHGRMSVKELGKKLYLDSGTLTPVLKSLESKGFVRRHRCQDDERVLIVEITPEGVALRDKALGIPGEMAACLNLAKEDFDRLYELLYKILDTAEKE